MKYLYLENRFKINLVLILLIAIIGFLVYRSIENNKEVYYSINDELTYNNYTIKVDSLYLTNHDYNGNEIKSKGVFVILNFKLKKNLIQRSTCPQRFDHCILSFDPALVLPVCIVHTMLLSRGRPKDSLCINYMTMYYITHLFTRKAHFPKKRQESFSHAASLRPLFCSQERHAHKS